MQSHHSSPERFVYSPEEFAFQFPFSYYASDQHDTMQAEEPHDKDRIATGEGGTNTDGNTASESQEQRSDKQQMQRHSSGDTAPSSNESVANVFSPWGAFSPADSVHTSARTMSFGPSSMSSVGVNWSRSPPVGLANAEEEGEGQAICAPMLCTGGAMGPLDAQPSSHRNTSKDYKDLDNLFDALGTTTKQGDGETRQTQNEPGLSADKDRFMPAVKDDAQPHRGVGVQLQPSLSDYKGYFESLYAQGAAKESAPMPLPSETDSFPRLGGLEGSAVWGAPQRLDDRSTTPQRSGLDTRHRNAHSVTDLYNWTPPHRAQDSLLEDLRAQTPFTAGHTAFNAAFNTSPESPYTYAHGIDVGAPLTPEYSIFVGDLCPDLREEDLVSQFLRPPHWPASHPFAIAHAHAQHAQGVYSTPAKIAPAPFLTTKSATIMTDPLTGASRGFGFVRFSSEQDCTRALIEMQGVIMTPRTGQAGRPLRVCPATPKNRSSSTSSLATTGALNAIGERVFGASTLPQQIGSTSPLAALNSTSNPVSTASLAQSSTPQASVVPPLQAGDNSARQYSASALDPSNTTVFVGGLSSLISEETLKTFFVPFGEIKYVKIPQGKGCGFVQFVRKMDAERAIERMQGFPIGGGRIRLSWGRSQGDKAAAAAAHAAAQAAQIGHLAGLAGLNPLTTSQLTAVTLAGSTGAGHTQEASQLLVRRLTAAAAAASAGREDRKALESLHGTSAELLSEVQSGAESAAFGLYRPQAPTAGLPSTTPGSSTSLSSAFAAWPLSTSTWPDVDPGPQRAQTLADQQLASMFGNMRFGGSGGGGVEGDSTLSSLEGSPSLFRERSHTYTMGASAAPQSQSGYASPFSSGSLAFTTTTDLRNDFDPTVRPVQAAASPTPKRSMNILTTDHSTLFRPFSPLPPGMPSVSPDTSIQQGHQESDNKASSHVSSNLSFKRYLEHLREQEKQQQQQQQQQKEAHAQASAPNADAEAPAPTEVAPVDGQETQVE